MALLKMIVKERKTEEHSYPKMESWKKGTDCCSWDGVTCDRVKENLIGLDLSCSWLQGIIPLNSSIPSSIGNLTKVTKIFLRSKYFTSQIPSLSKLKDLNLIDLRFNNLRGRIPDFLTNLTRLTKVYLSYNQLTSQIGEFQSSNSLQILRLENNMLYGSIPKSISNLVNLIELDISSYRA
nr:receptor-like protein 12 [Quercus suber]